MSVAVMAIVAAMNSVMQPIVGDHQQHFGREDRIERGRPGTRRRRPSSPSGRGRETGVGPSIASGKPDVQRELGTLADAAAEDAEAGDEQQPVAAGRVRIASQPARRPQFDRGGRIVRRRGHRCGHLIPGLERDHAVGRHELVVVRFGVRSWLKMPGSTVAVGVRHVAEGERAERRPERHQADEHAEVADAVDDERLVGGGRRRSCRSM